MEGGDLGDELLYEACHETLAKPELFRVILGCLGSGHFCFVAGVCEEWKNRYTDRYPAAKTNFSTVVSSVECLNWATSRQGLELSDELFNAAVGDGNVEVCVALHDKGCAFMDYGTYTEATFNKEHGLAVLQWLRSEDLPGKEECPWDESISSICQDAAAVGNLEILKWLMSDEVGAEMDSDSWTSACMGGGTPVLEWLLEHPSTRALLEENEDGQWRKGILKVAGSGDLDALQLLYAKARDLFDWGADVCFIAVMKGAVLAAIKGDSLAMLKWLRSEEVQCDWDERSCPQVIRDRGLYPEWEWDETAVWDIEAETFEEVKQWVHSNGHPCDCQD